MPNMLSDYICSSTAVYVIFLDLSKPSDLKEWFDKKFKLRCRQYFFALSD